MSFKGHCDCESNDSTVKTSNETQTSYICEKCGQNLKSKAALLSHAKWRHENPNSNLKCNVCQKIFTRNSHLDRHQKSCQNRCKYRKKDKNCCFCDFTTSNRAEVLVHYEVNHNINITKKTLNFNTFEEFKIWKQKFEKDTKSYFIKRTHTRQTKGGANISNYICHRDGYFKSRSKGIRQMKMGGSNKMNSHCPASIAVYETDQSVKVVYVDTHVGHQLDVSRLKISESEKTDIAEKLANKIPFEQILDDIRDSVVNGERDRIHLATRKDLWNIVASYNLNHEAILNKNEYSSIEAWVLHMQKSSNLVRFYKPQEVILEDVPQLEQNDFFLVIMNDAQKEILLKFGNDCVCIDRTHDLNAYDFQLHTLLVLDYKKQAFPCSFLFSNRGDSEAMELFFKVLKDCLHETSVEPKTFISDMDDTFIDAWSAVIGPVQNRLFSTWHIDRAWRDNLGKIENKEKQAVVYQKIKMIMHEPDLDTFNVMVNNLLEELRLDSDCLDFLEYFETYMEKCTSWAYCHRKQCGINSDMSNLEHMHRILKHICFGGKKVKRMDKAITMLMKFIRDKLFDGLVLLNKGKISKKLASIRHIHKKSLELTSTIIDLGNSWHVSATNCDNFYRVEASNPSCTCNLRCQDCESCIHNFTCSCTDFSLKWNMCKHIHLVCTFLKSNIPAEESVSTEVSTNTPEEVIYYEMDHLITDVVSDPADGNEEECTILEVASEPQQDSFDKRKQDVIDKLLQLCNTIENEEQLEAVSKRVPSLESIINALSNKNIPIPRASNKPPIKKLDHT